MQYWQIESGANGRDYSKYFKKYGMAFVGGKKYMNRMEQIEKGDIVVLKRGLQEILAAGRVTKRYSREVKEWLKDFDGWDLPGYCHVDWKENLENSTPPRGLARHAIARVNKREVKNKADEILCFGGELEVSPEPRKTEPVGVNEILKYLKEAGLKTSSADEFTSAIDRIRLLAEYYFHAKFGWHWILEHETRTFLVVPLLLALGWSEQQIKIELACKGGKVDIALFRKNFERNMDDCVVIIETKAFHFGLDYADKQAKIYSKNFPSCNVLITTNGHCYKIYNKNGANEFKTDPSAYMNLRKPTKKYPIDPKNVDGALEAIKWLLPNRYSG